MSEHMKMLSFQEKPFFTTSSLGWLFFFFNFSVIKNMIFLVITMYNLSVIHSFNIHNIDNL